jgi:hypothetical protein
LPYHPYFKEFAKVTEIGFQAKRKSRFILEGEEGIRHKVAEENP